MKTQLNEIRRMQKLAGIINESHIHTAEENMEEGWKSWLTGGLLTLSTLAGGMKVYQMDKEIEKDRQAQQEYYDNVLSRAIEKMSPEEQEIFYADLGTKIEDKFDKFSLAPDSKITSIEYSQILSREAKKYVEDHPNEFSISQKDGTIHWKYEDAAAYE